MRRDPRPASSAVVTLRIDRIAPDPCIGGPVVYLVSSQLEHTSYPATGLRRAAAGRGRIYDAGHDRDDRLRRGRSADHDEPGAQGSAGPDSERPRRVCHSARYLVIQPTDTKEIGLAEERFTENQLRPVDRIIAALLALDSAPLAVARSFDRRVVGTCRHFAVLSCALLRYRGIAARARCGFATYFQPNQGLDHWITEYWHDGRWYESTPRFWVPPT